MPRGPAPCVGLAVRDGGPARFGEIGNRAGGARFYPYGNEITLTANDREKFGTYTRDAYTGLDISPNRAYASVYGRFTTADPSTNGQGSSETAGWNRYAYVGGDPINRLDPKGTDWVTDLLYDSGFLAAGDGLDPTGIGAEVYAQISGVLAGAALQAAALAAASPPPPAPPPAVWDLDVGYTPVMANGKPVVVNGEQYDHLFVWLHLAGVTPSSTLTAANSVVYDGGPAGNCLPSCGSVTAWEGATGHYGEVTNRSMVDFYSQAVSAYLQSQLQLVFTGLSSALSASYNPIMGPNSNSVAYTLLRDISVNLSAIGPTKALGTAAGSLNFNGQTQIFTGWGQFLQYP